VIFGGSPRGLPVPVPVNLGLRPSGLGQRPFVDNIDSVLPSYPNRVLDRAFPLGGVVQGWTTLVLPTYEKQFSVTTSLEEEWSSFYESLWTQAEASLARSDQIVVIGYSMPEADHRSRALLLWNSNKRAGVSLCCASSNKGLRAQFENHGFWRVSEIGTFADLFA
jgi:hypothetical protein